MRLLTKILLLVLGPLLLMSGLSALHKKQLMDRLDADINSRLVRKAEEVRRDFLEFLDHTRKASAVLVNSGEIIQAMSIQDSDLLFQRASLFVDMGLDRVIFINRHGVVLARGQDEFRFGDDLTGQPVYESVRLSGRSMTTVAPFDERPCLLTAAPVLDRGGTATGVLVAGMELSPGLLARVARNRQVEMTLKLGSTVMNSWPGDGLPGWDRMAAELPIGLDDHPADQAQLGLTVYEDNREQRQTLSSMRNDLLLATGLCAALLMALAVFLVRRILGPVNILASAMETYSQAGELSPQDRARLALTMDQGHETMVLARAFLRMAGRIEDQHSRLLELLEENKAAAAQLAKNNSTLAGFNQELESLVALRTSELAQARDAAESASQAKSNFLATMSHEIRTPLNAIIGIGDLFAESPLSDEQKGYLALLHNASHTLLSLVSNILDLSRIEAGMLELETKPFRLRQTLDRVVELMALKALDKGLALNCTVQQAVPELLVGDEPKLSQVLVNLLGNAIKFTDEGEIILDVWDAGQEGEEHRLLQFSVLDTGVGIPEEKADMIFEPFTQVDSSTSRRFGGSGLGLAITRKLVELMGGEIWVKSDPGRGSTFFFTVRMACAPESEQPPAQAVAPPPSQPGESRSMRILLAEDSENNRMLIDFYLKGSGHVIDMAENGSMAVDLYEANAYDLVFMDIQMPVMNGYQATREIRRMERETGRPPTPIVALTANAMTEDRILCMEAGCTDYLPKPVKKRVILDAIAAYVGGPPKDGSEETPPRE